VLRNRVVFGRSGGRRCRKRNVGGPDPIYPDRAQKDKSTDAPGRLLCKTQRSLHVYRPEVRKRIRGSFPKDMGASREMNDYVDAFERMVPVRGALDIANQNDIRNGIAQCVPGQGRANGCPDSPPLAGEPRYQPGSDEPTCACDEDAGLRHRSDGRRTATTVPRSWQERTA